MYPHCSEYGKTAFSRFSPLKAWLITADRLHRCGHDLGHYTAILLDGQVRYVDSTLITPPKRVDVEFDNGLSSKAVEHTASPSTLSSGSLRDLALAGTNTTATLDTAQWEFANALMSEGNSQLALLEFKRLLYYHPNSDFRKLANVSIFRCLMRLGEPLGAANYGVDLFQTEDSAFYRTELSNDVAICYIGLGNLPAALDHLTNSLSNSSADRLTENLELRAIVHSIRGAWSEAKAELQKVPTASRYYPRTARKIAVCDLAQSPPHKNPSVAGLLSIIPGLGYFYSGYVQTAISTLLVNGLFAWGTYEAFDNGNNGMGTFLAITSAGWYVGNIYGSIASAKRINASASDQMMIEMKIGYSF